LEADRTDTQPRSEAVRLAGSLEHGKHHHESGGGGWGEVRDKNPVLGRVFRSITKKIYQKTDYLF
jgi:hypothetical protein